MDLREVMEEFLVYMKVEKNASEQTIYAYRSDISQLVEFMESIGLASPVEAVS
ncbi:MAG: site-specific integrase [Bacillota bacterium]